MSSNTPVSNVLRKNSLRSGSGGNKTNNVGETSEFMLMMTQLSKRIDLLETNLTAAIDTKIENVATLINSKISELNDRINNVEKNLIKKMLDNDDEILKKSEVNIGQVHNKITAMNTHLNNTCDLINQRIDLISNNEVNISLIDDRISDLERLSHGCDLIIRGIPKEVRDLKQVFDEMSKAISCNIDHNSIGTIFRLPNGSILVKFISVGAKQYFFSMYLKQHNLNLSHIGYQVQNRIYINECLSKNTAMLLRVANTMRKDGWIFKTYTKNGYLFIRKSETGEDIKITSKTQLLSSKSSGSHTTLNST